MVGLVGVTGKIMTNINEMYQTLAIEVEATKMKVTQLQLKMEDHCGDGQQEIADLKELIHNTRQSNAEELKSLNEAVKALVIATTKMEATMSTVSKMVGFGTPLMLVILMGIAGYNFTTIQQNHLDIRKLEEEVLDFKYKHPDKPEQSVYSTVAQ